MYNIKLRQFRGGNLEKIELNSLTLMELKSYMVSIGESAFRGEQVFSYFHRNKKFELEYLSLLPEKLRKNLKDNSKVNKIKVFKKLQMIMKNIKMKYTMLFINMLKQNLNI